MEYVDGIALVAENPSGTLHKISEIYDRIAFAGVGKYNEFEMLKIGGIRHADVRGYQYSREDVTARALANVYAQTLGQVFTHEMKPYEVEILVAQVGESADEANEMFHILYDGTVMDEHGFTVLGGQAEAIIDDMKAQYGEGLDMGAAVRLGTKALGGPDGRDIAADLLEVAVLDRTRPRRKFRRLQDDEVDALLAG
jgi:proteasome alpha subunit